MSGANDRRAPRILSEFPLTLLDDSGAELDPHATAHDVSEKGFKIESRAELKPGQFVRFSLSLDVDGGIDGRARIVWSKRTDLSYWAGGEFLKLPGRDKRRMRRIMNPSAVDWNALADKAIFALALLLATLLGWSLLSNALWRGFIGDMMPTILAALAMGWALRVLLRRR
jgi:hypothetical protein